MSKVVQKNPRTRTFVVFLIQGRCAFVSFQDIYLFQFSNESEYDLLEYYHF